MVDASGTGADEASGGAARAPSPSRRTIGWAVGLSLALMIAVGGVALLVRRIYTDGLSIHRPAGEAAPRDVLWEKPEPLPGPLAGDADVYEPSVSRDGRRLFFVQGRRPGGNGDLFVSSMGKDGWEKAEPIEEINTSDDELGPELTSDGRLLFFYSDRPGGLGRYDLWVSVRGKESWGAPVNLGPEVNSPFNEFGPAVSPLTGRFYFTSDRPDRPLKEADRTGWQTTLRSPKTRSDWDIYAADLRPGDRGTPPLAENLQRVDSLSTEADEGQVAFTPRGDLVYFSSNRGGGRGGYDLYRSREIDGAFRPSRNLGPAVNSPGDEMDPALTTHGFELYFSSDRIGSDPAGSETGGEPFALYHTISRDVAIDTDVSGLGPLLDFLAANKWWILALILTALVLAYLIQMLMGRRRALNLVQQCLLLSLLLHLLMVFLMSSYMVATAIYETAKREKSELEISSDALSLEKLQAGTREQVADLKPAEDTSSEPVTRVDVEIRDREPLPRAPEVIQESTFVVPPIPIDSRVPVKRPEETPDLIPVPRIRDLQPMKRPKAAISLEVAEAEREAEADVPKAADTQSSERITSATPLPEAGKPLAQAPKVTSEPTAPAARSAVSRVAPESPDGSQEPVPNLGPDLFRAPSVAARPTPSLRMESNEAVKKEPEGAKVGPLLPDAGVARRVDVRAPDREAEAPPVERATLPGARAARSAVPRAKPGPPSPAVAFHAKVRGPEPRLPSIPLPGRLRLEGAKGLDSPYMLRNPEKRGRVLEKLGGTKETESAVVRALEWLKQNQEPDGRWSIGKHGGQGGHDNAATGFAILCYYGWGAKHTEPGEYQEVLKKAVGWLAQRVKKDGDVTGGRDNGMYDHGVATLALAEAYGLTHDPALRAPLQAAIAFIVKAQSRKHGGWRYRATSKDGDTSVFGWQVMALRSAALAGLDVPGESFKRAGDWLKKVGGGKQGGLYGYQGKSPKAAMVAEGMFSKFLLGGRNDAAELKESAEYLRKYLPGKGETNQYYWYYGSLALYQQKGPVWDEWNIQIKKVLLDSQSGRGKYAGSWDPKGQWGDACGRVITTAMATLCLEVYYRYLPLTRPDTASD